MKDSLDKRKKNNSIILYFDTSLDGNIINIDRTIYLKKLHL